MHSVKPSRRRSCTRTRKRRLLPRTLKTLMHVFGCVSVSLLYCWPSVLCGSINSREHHYLLGLGMTWIQLFFTIQVFKKMPCLCGLQRDVFALVMYAFVFFCVRLFTSRGFCGCTHQPLCVWFCGSIETVWLLASSNCPSLGRLEVMGSFPPLGRDRAE